jgi:O-acetyl-ADP-ribose deacetylase (regulator of RNase III)/uncharacterized protein YwgA
MMSRVQPLIGDIFESKAQTLVNTANTVGVMGKGLALEFRKRFPDMYDDYLNRCERHELRLGQPYLYKRLVPPWILVFPTKEHWRSVSRLSDIEAGLEYLKLNCRTWGITSLAVPPLGCGLGQLEWEAVGPTLYRHLAELDIPVQLYAPEDTPVEELTPTFLSQPSEAQLVECARNGKPGVPPGLIVVLEALRRIEGTRYHWPIGRVAFQKLAYFATQMGLDTRLSFRRSSFGPYDENAKAIMTKLVNNGLLEEQHSGGGKTFRVMVGPTFEDVRKRYAAEIAANEDNITRLVDLFCRIKSTHQAELVSTIHFAQKTMRHSPAGKPSEVDVLNEVLEWKKKHRPSYDEAEVGSTIRVLAVLGWLDVTPSVELPTALEPA